MIRTKTFNYAHEVANFLNREGIKKEDIIKITVRTDYEVNGRHTAEYAVFYEV